MLGLIVLATLLQLVAPRSTGIQVMPAWLTPQQFLLALSPIVYFYVISIIKPDRRFRQQDLWHGIPFALIIPITSLYQANQITTSIITYTFAFISFTIYSIVAQNLIKRATNDLKFDGNDRYLLKYRWLKIVLPTLTIIWLLWVTISLCNIPDQRLPSSLGYFLLLILGTAGTFTAGAVILRPELHEPEVDPDYLRQPPANDLKHKGAWLKSTIKSRGYYRDPELSLNTLAKKLGMTTHYLSRIINTVLNKSFNDLINEYRVADVCHQLKNRSNEHLTLEGIAYEAGFNSPRTFHRAFKQVTGRTPAEYKKELPSYNLAYPSPKPAIISKEINRKLMFKNYLKIAWRNITRKKASSIINISGLAVGMAVAMLIGLWIHDELTFDQSNANYDQIVEVMANGQAGGGLVTQYSLPIPVSSDLKGKYGSDFRQVASTITFEQNVNYNNHAFTKTGCYAEPAITDILTLKMIHGSAASFKTPGKVLINESFAKILFGDKDPVNQTIKLNDSFLAQVSGVYEDFPKNTQFSGMDFIAPLDMLFQNGGDKNNWYNSSSQVYALVNKGANLRQLSHKIENILYEHTKDATKPALFLFPMRQWHLYEFKNGVVVAGRLQFVWLFCLIGVFVLLLACINFMNLSTARSEKRAKEVGIRKAIGSVRGQLIAQFLSESILIVVIAFIFAIAICWLSLSYFNEVSGKELHLIWTNPYVWLICIGFCLLTGLLAGSYPAIYLSSFNAVKVLKGTFKAGATAALPRKVLVVLQFTVSVTMIIGTIVVFKQIEFAKDRPVGYDRSNLVSVPFNAIKGYEAFKHEVLNSGAVTGVSASSNPTTGVWSSADNLSWSGKDPNRQEVFGTVLVDPDFGGVVGWQMKAGRNFSGQSLTDSAGFIFNEAAIKQMGLKEPIGENIKWHGKDWKVLGVVKDMVMTSPFDPVTPVVFLMDDRQRSFNVVNLKLKAGIPVSTALNQIETVYKKFAPEAPFSYKFADSEYAQKFIAEERTGKLASVFAVLAIFISCLGLFGVASFIAEQRIKEIGIRKVLGASVITIWASLSKEFVLLVGIALLIAVPVSWYAMYQWLQHYTYRTDLSGWVFILTGVGALLLTLLTVSYHTLKAALSNPVKSLRSE